MSVGIGIGRKVSLLLFLMLMAAVANTGVVSYYQRAQKHDLRIVNIAGRQRMLSQRITKSTLIVAEGNDDYRKDLHEAIVLYDSSLEALWHGGTAMSTHIPKAPHSMERLFRKNKDIWDPIREKAEIVWRKPREADDFKEAVGYITDMDETLLQISDEVTGTFDAIFSRKVIELRAILFAMLIFDILVFMLGWALGKKLTAPISALSRAAREVGKGDLTKKIRHSSHDEIGDLCVSFNAMIDDLKVSHDQIKAKTVQLTSAYEELGALKRDLEKKAEARTVALKNAQDRLIRSEKWAAIGKLAGIMGHELRNPLGVIRNSVYFLNVKLDQAIEDQKIRKHLKIINEEVAISDRIIADILSFGRVHDSRFVVVNIESIIRLAMEAIKVPRSIKVKIKCAVPDVIGDKIQLNQVFTNIILNALQAMPKGGSLTITGERVGEHIELSFRDTGCGIDEKDLDKIFDPLFSTKIKGTGLGLSICQHIIEMYKGSIEVTSEIGKGTAFVIKLPITGRQER